MYVSLSLSLSLSLASLCSPQLYFHLTQIILDGNFIFAAIKFHVDIQERLGKLLQGEEIRLFILKSSMRELEKQGSKAASSLTFARSFCEPLDDDASVGETIEEKVFHFISCTREEAKMNSKARKYIFATQDKGKITLFITLNSQY